MHDEYFKLLLPSPVLFIKLLIPTYAYMFYVPMVLKEKFFIIDIYKIFFLIKNAWFNSVNEVKTCYSLNITSKIFKIQ